MDRVLAIPDLHIPGMLDTYPDFLWETKKAWKCNRFIFLGDVFNLGALSYHLKHSHEANLDSELDQAREQIKPLAKMFKKAELLLGNHDALTERKAADVGIPGSLLKSYNEVFDLPKTWQWYPRYHQLLIDNVIYQHGDRGAQGQHAAFRNASAEFRSVVQGHLHSQFSIEYLANAKDCIWGMQAGTGVNHDDPIFSYGKSFTRKPIVGCGVIIEGHPYLERMVL